ncbi:hypothetical protein AcV7_008640 [Taiwanofungus camphoratus]|nr:hypothetical protein AcV7_008640 [Antrodia cinnamomea]
MKKLGLRMASSPPLATIYLLISQPTLVPAQNRLASFGFAFSSGFSLGAGERAFICFECIATHRTILPRRSVRKKVLRGQQAFVTVPSPPQAPLSMYLFEQASTVFSIQITHTHSHSQLHLEHLSYLGHLSSHSHSKILCLNRKGSFGSTSH